MVYGPYLMAQLNQILFLNVGPLKEDIFLTTFYGLYKPEGPALCNYEFATKSFDFWTINTSYSDELSSCELSK